MIEDIKLATSNELNTEAERLYDEFEKVKGELHECYLKMQRISEEYQMVDAEINKRNAQTQKT